MTFEFVIHLRHVDSAGVVFFARFFELAHDAYERFMEALGHPLPPDMARSDIILPIVHAHSDYHGFLRLGDRVCITISVEKISTRSYGLSYAFTRGDGESCATVRTVHVAVDRAQGRAVQLPETLRKALQGFEASSGSASV